MDGKFKYSAIHDAKFDVFWAPMSGLCCIKCSTVIAFITMLLWDANQETYKLTDLLTNFSGDERSQELFVFKFTTCMRQHGGAFV